MPVGLLSLQIHFAGCHSLKEKRARIKPILHRLHREFNVSTAELEYNDIWKDALLGMACVSNDSTFIRQVFQEIQHFFQRTWPDVEIVDERIEIL